MSQTLTGPLTGGIVPGGLTGQQLSAITRRAVRPVVTVQIYQNHPMLAFLMQNAQRAKGGVSMITIPTQGQSFVSFSWGDFSGTFPQPQDVAAINNAQFNIKMGMVPIGFFGMEAIIQSSEVIIPKLRVVTSDAATVIRQSLATALYANSYNQPQVLDSLVAAYDAGTLAPSYGGIARAGNVWWQGQYYPNSANVLSNRASLATAIVRTQTAAGGEAPDFGVCNPADWATLLTDFIGIEQMQITPQNQIGRDGHTNSGFRAIQVLGTPIFPDPFCPRGEMYLINTKYLALYMSDYLNFAFTGFQSLIPLGQLASIGVLLAGLDLVCSKPSSGAHFTGLSTAGWSQSSPALPAVV